MLGTLGGEQAKELLVGSSEKPQRCRQVMMEISTDALFLSVQGSMEKKNNPPKRILEISFYEIN